MLPSASNADALLRAAYVLLLASREIEQKRLAGVVVKSPGVTDSIAASRVHLFRKPLVVLTRTAGRTRMLPEMVCGGRSESNVSSIWNYRRLFARRRAPGKAGCAESPASLCIFRATRVSSVISSKKEVSEELAANKSNSPDPGTKPPRAGTSRTISKTQKRHRHEIRCDCGGRKNSEKTPSVSERPRQVYQLHQL